VRDLIAEVVFHFRLNSLFIKRINHVHIYPVPAQKIAVALMKLPE